MKVLTGALRGQSIRFRPNPSLRPTPDKAREALAQRMRAIFENATVLDLFSGTGALGMEALSLEARRVDFVELERRQCTELQKTLSDLKVGDERCGVYAHDAFKFLQGFSSEGAGYDVILADPPYDTDDAQRLISAVGVSPALREGGWLVVETRKKNLLEGSGMLKLYDTRLYGDTRFSFFRQISRLTLDS
ncbi:MAG: 16S rRNA (guanine(966)-N(2))-methyltransferase RsmD [Candidatus Omnitrophica bacterium]|nr:16S rRNA (guanine(966)-N(2))-methyltransferase RsmD [Candidatus Omnitrophota bacterium]